MCDIYYDIISYNYMIMTVVTKMQKILTTNCYLKELFLPDLAHTFYLDQFCDINQYFLLKLKI